ncbi:MAG: acyl carrier protein [Firmicutes bacterium]|nr:acyl carrier protein [Bacillota bacterium]
MEKLLSILSDLHPEIDFSSHSALIDEGVLDSFDIVTIIADVDDAYGLSIPAAEIVPENFNSALALFSLIRRLS